MGLLDPFKDRIYAAFSDWVEIQDLVFAQTIEDYPYDKGAEDENHCWRCTTVNRCWFKNREGKKPY